MLRANIELADSTEESAEDITAAETAPSPRKVIAGGHKYCITNGKISFSSSFGMGRAIRSWMLVLFQSRKIQKRISFLQLMRCSFKLTITAGELVCHLYHLCVTCKGIIQFFISRPPQNVYEKFIICKATSVFTAVFLSQRSHSHPWRR